MDGFKITGSSLCGCIGKRRKKEEEKEEEDI
jgi:hypothetical protein